MAKLRRVVERDKERHNVEPDNGEPVVVEPSDVVDVDSDDKIDDEPYDAVRESLPGVNFDPQSTDGARSSKRKHSKTGVLTEKKKRGRPRKPESEKVCDEDESEEVYIEVCPICKVKVDWEDDALQCEGCETWTHKTCLDVYIICGYLYFPFVGMCHHYHLVSCNMKLNPLVFLYSVSGFVSNQLSLYYITLYIYYI